MFMTVMHTPSNKVLPNGAENLSQVTVHTYASEVVLSQFGPICLNSCKIPDLQINKTKTKSYTEHH